MKKIVLLGYMGCGKSTIAKLLASDVQIPYLDLDEIIEKRCNCSITELFRQKGEVYFRKLEHQIFKELIQNPESFVLSLGGGAPCYANNHEMLLDDGVISIYLQASIDTLYNRLLLGKTNRPLVADTSPDEMKEFIAKHLFERSYFYNHAKHKVIVDDKSKTEVVNEIRSLIDVATSI
jgi:shikimate kinase